MSIEAPSVSLGLSYLFPVVPILSFLSFTCCMLLLPGIIKTRVFALIFYLVWSSLGNLLIAINMCIWRNSTHNAPIYGDIVARIMHLYSITLYLSICCLAKFTWNITRPASSLKVIDQRKRYNRFDAFLCIGVSLLLFPLLVINTKGRYLILEDIGPLPYDQPTLGGFFVNAVPITVATIASVCFSVLTAINIWRARRVGSHPEGIPGQPPYRPLSTLQALRYSTNAVCNSIGMIFGCLWVVLPHLLYPNEIVDDEGRPWYTVFDIQSNLKQLPLIGARCREEIETENWTNLAGFLISVPVNGLLFFLMFGFGSGIFSSYRPWLDLLHQNMSDTMQKYIPRRFSPSTDLENFTPFQLDEIMLEQLPPPTQTTKKVYPEWTEAGLLPPTIPPPSPLSPLSSHHSRSVINRESPVSPLERSRTLRKEPIPLRLLPVNRSQSNNSLAFEVNTPRDTLFTRHSPKNASSSRTGPRDGIITPINEVPPPYIPPGRQASSRQTPSPCHSHQDGGTSYSQTLPPPPRGN